MAQSAASSSSTALEGSMRTVTSPSWLATKRWVTPLDPGIPTSAEESRTNQEDSVNHGKSSHLARHWFAWPQRSRFCTVR